MTRIPEISLALTVLPVLLTACGAAAEPRVVTLAGSEEGYVEGLGADVWFNGPLDVAVDADGNVYVADSTNHTAGGRGGRRVGGP